MLFAAGLGTRMGALTAEQPKPMIPVAGRPLIDHALDLVTEAGIPDVVVNIHWKGEKLRRHLSGRPVQISDESDALLETGGGLRRALPLLGEGAVWTLNPDVLWSGPNPLRTLAPAWDPARMSSLLLLAPISQLRGYRGEGDFTLHDDGRISRGGPLVYLGAQIIDPQGIETVPDQAFSLNRLWDMQIAAGRAHGTIYPGQWCDVGRPEGIALAEAMLIEGASRVHG